ncbi:MAG: Heavy metal sensor histidine kinase [Acidobacteriota bacterium]
MFSLRIKLTIYYLAILTLILVGMGVASYIYLSRTLLATIDASLFDQVDRIERHLAHTAGIGSASRVNRHELLVDLTPHLTQIIDVQGKVIDEVLDLPRYAVSVDRLALAGIAPGRTEFSTMTNGEQQVVRLATRRVSSREQERGEDLFIRSGQSLESIAIARRRLLFLLAVAVPLALLMGGLGGGVIANQALRPVDRIRRTAERINGGDLTERVPLPGTMDEIGQLAATFNQMIARLQAAFDRQRQFTSDASHELRTPLAIMRGDIEIALRRIRTSDEYQTVLTSTLDEVVRLSRLIEDLLLLARADIGKVELQCRPMNLSLLCRDLIDYIAPLAHQQGLDLNLRLPASPKGEDVIIIADENRLRQLLLNLIGNAIKYTDSGGWVELSLDRDDRWIVIQVRDNGRGIPAEDQPQIFERFFRRSRMATEPNIPGSGLGLAISKWIVESHGGTIGVRSEAGQGTEVTVRLR